MPVLSQMELRFIIALAARKRCIPKTGDIKQAFCQSSLPPDENYICRPPPGCPVTPPNTYWKLKKTLYGLKRSPRHFYELATKLLLSLGLKQHPLSPCLFSGSIIKNKPPLYLGLYVDDFIYFSKDKSVETTFEQEFSKKIDIDFNGQVSCFLGIKFNAVKHDDGEVDILMNQPAFIKHLAHTAGLSDVTTIPTAPYRNGFPMDSIPTPTIHNNDQDKLTKTMHQLVGSLNWLAISTRPNISTITNMIVKYTSAPSKQHIQAAKQVI